MQFRGKLSKLKWLWAALFVSLAVLPFQNCGPALESDEGNLFLSSTFSNDDCLSAVVDCGPQSSFLGILLDLSNPTVLPTSTTNIDAFGRCNSGNFPEHYIRVEVISPDQGVVNSLEVGNACQDGLYDIEVSLAGVDSLARYTLRVQIVGVFDGQPFTGGTSQGSAQVDFSLQDL